MSIRPPTQVLPRSELVALACRRRVAVAGLGLCAFVVHACSAAPAVEQGANQTQAGVVAADQGYWEEAEFRWLKALAIANLNARALNNLAVRQERLGEFETAKEYYDEALLLASAAERFYIERNHQQFVPIWDRIVNREIEAGEAGGETGPSDAAVAAEQVDDDGNVVLPGDQFDQEAATTVGSVEILVSVPDQGPNLAGFDRVLVGNFVSQPDSEANLNDFAVRHFRRRITQRTFFETQDRLEAAAEPELRETDVLENAAYWVRAAADVEADLILTGSMGLATEMKSEMVRERIRSPTGEIREVARFQDSVFYTITYNYVILRGEDGERLLEGSLSAEQSFPADEGIDNQQAVFETLETLLPQVLDIITPRRSEQSRYLVY